MGVLVAIALAVGIVALASALRNDPCERLAAGPVFQIVADHGAVERKPLTDAVEDAFAQAGMPRFLTWEDIQIVREEGPLPRRRSGATSSRVP